MANKENVSHLNAVLKNELTSINQYFLHARILKNMGFFKLADHEYKESIDEMKHADQLIERILYLEGLPNVQDIGKLGIGETVEEILKSDLRMEEVASVQLKTSIAFYESKGDYASGDLLHKILASEEEHILFLRTQLNMIDTMGLSAYLQTQV